MVVLDEKSEDQQSHYPPGTLSICYKFTAVHSCEYISLETKNVSLIVALLHPLETMNVCIKFRGHPTVIIQSGQKWWTDQQTDIDIPGAASMG